MSHDTIPFLMYRVGAGAAKHVKYIHQLFDKKIMIWISLSNQPAHDRMRYITAIILYT
jgi:hypothetical protein